MALSIHMAGRLAYNCSKLASLVRSTSAQRLQPFNEGNSCKKQKSKENVGVAGLIFVFVSRFLRQFARVLPFNPRHLETECDFHLIKTWFANDEKK